MKLLTDFVKNVPMYKQLFVFLLQINNNRLKRNSYFTCEYGISLILTSNALKE